MADYPNLQTLEITGEFSEIGLENCPNLERVDASKDINQVYFTKIKNCPKLNVPKVRVNEKYLNQSCMFENSKVEKLRLIFGTILICKFINPYSARHII